MSVTVLMPVQGDGVTDDTAAIKYVLLDTRFSLTDLS
jgi:hypothetical protein